MTDRSAITTAIAEGKQRIGDLDSETRRRLAERYAQTWLNVEAELRFTDYQLRALRVTEWFTEDGRLTEYGEVAFRQQRLERLLPMIEDEYRRTANVSLSDLNDMQRQAVSIGTQTAGTMSMEAGVGAALNVEAYERIVAATDPGSPLRLVLDRYGAEAREAIARHLIEGMIAGNGIEDIIEAIRGEIGDGVPRWKLAAISRTESMRAFRGSLGASYEAMGVQEVQWTASLSQRTCKACLAMHGRRFPVTYEMESHPQCRCVLTPVVEGIAGPTGDEWFRMQPEAWQREHLGKAYPLYQSGVIDLAAFVGRRRSRIWGTSVVERSITDVIGRAA